MAAPRVITNRRQIQAIVKAYSRGDSLNTIAERYEVSASTIRNYLLEEGVTLRPKGGRKAI